MNRQFKHGDRYTGMRVIARPYCESPCNKPDTVKSAEECWTCRKATGTKRYVINDSGVFHGQVAETTISFIPYQNRNGILMDMLKIL